MKKTAELSLEVAKEMYKSGGVAKQFALDNYTEQELTTREVKCWEDLDEIAGYFVDENSSVYRIKEWGNSYNKNTFATKDQAEAAIAMAMLSQLMKDVNGDWKPDWEDRSLKYIIGIYKEVVWTGSGNAGYRRFLAFPTEEIRDKFLDNHRELIEKAKPLL